MAAYTSITCFNQSADVQLLPDGTLMVNGVPYMPPASSDDQQISIVGDDIELEDGGTIDGEICTDLAGNPVGLIIQP